MKLQDAGYSAQNNYDRDRENYIKSKTKNFRKTMTAAGLMILIEVDERHAALDGNEMCDSGETHDLLYACLTQHRTARLTRCHDVALIAENIEGGSRQSTGAHMEDIGKELAGNLVEVRDHQ